MQVGNIHTRNRVTEAHQNNYPVQIEITVFFSIDKTGSVVPVRACLSYLSLLKIKRCIEVYSLTITELSLDISAPNP